MNGQRTVRNIIDILSEDAERSTARREKWFRIPNSENSNLAMCVAGNVRRMVSILVQPQMVSRYRFFFHYIFFADTRVRTGGGVCFSASIEFMLVLYLKYKSWLRANSSNDQNGIVSICHSGRRIVFLGTCAHVKYFSCSQLLDNCSGKKRTSESR